MLLRRAQTGRHGQGPLESSDPTFLGLPRQDPGAKRGGVLFPWIELTPILQQERGLYGEDNFRPMTPARIRPMRVNRAAVAASLNSHSPINAVPAAPIPVHTA